MPAITDRSTQPPLLQPRRISHGTLECDDLVKTRRFYEEVLGIECIQTGSRALMVRLGTEHVYAVIETPRAKSGMPLLNHNGLDVGSPEEVEAAHETIVRIKDEWGLKKVQNVSTTRGETSFYFQDFDGNWWEILAPGPGGYIRDFEDKDEFDLTGRHDLDDIVGTNFHTHDPEFRKRIARPAD